MKKLPVIVLLSAALGAVFSTSCATSKGFGEDLQKVGGKIEQKADETGGAR